MARPALIDRQTIEMALVGYDQEMLNDGIPIKLVVDGEVVRSVGEFTAVRGIQREFVFRRNELKGTGRHLRYGRCLNNADRLE